MLVLLAVPVAAIVAGAGAAAVAMAAAMAGAVAIAICMSSWLDAREFGPFTPIRPDWIYLEVIIQSPRNIGTQSPPSFI